jgi:hypothetical protein
MMVARAEARAIERFARQGFQHCIREVGGQVWADKAGVEHTVPATACGGRLKPLRDHGQVRPDVLCCARCAQLYQVSERETAPHQEQAPA